MKILNLLAGRLFFWTNKEKAEFFVYLKIERKNICFEKMKPIFQITFF